jgi:hypothetical protein
MYYQLPNSITKNDKPILNDVDIDETDYQYAARIYPKADQPKPNPPTPPTSDEVWIVTGKNIRIERKLDGNV